ncbi:MULTISPECIES: hypothetical protein [Mesonia]|uniref:Uncharacterized protein n=1 Tax=Mesonia oceanica TaxID=2687242 RepID=A0AC61YD94_9FLAO|nr:MULTISPECIES: hypothetical protein [Mesonia]MAN27096.1 hypothetical protein [Mesonia sp.]MAQ41983.1 hypothetical protein [Mesonia sp.]MBJ97662.1 hypothetical protein [Flavobacteriaceae bacterium]VVV02083.1 hypothetical protein FVB9532_03379 [Mesonia oceanica]
MNNPQGRVQAFLLVNNLAFIAGIMFSFKLWITRRNFPVIPLFDFIPEFSTSFNLIPVIVLIALLAIQIIYKKPFIFLLSILTIGFLLVQDAMRWQPWVYLYTVFIIPFCFKKIKASQVLSFFQIILIGVYFWSGLYKLNSGFTEIIFPKMILQVLHINLSKYSYLGYFIPITELLVAVGFVIKKTRNIAFYLAASTHLLILVWLSPIGGNTNSVIIPWNIAMIVFTYLCFYKNEIEVFTKPQTLKKPLTLIAFIIILLPGLYKVGYWPYYFSFQLYSGQGQSSYISLPDKQLLEQHPNFINACYPFKEFPQKNIVKLSYWSYFELNVPTPPDTKIYHAVMKDFCNNYPEVEFYHCATIEASENCKKLTCDDSEIPLTFEN